MKLAALEGLGRTTTGAPVHIGGWYSDGEVHFGLPIPRLLSILAAHDPNATIRGLSSFPADELPPVNVVRLAFQTMVGLGLAMALLAVCYLWVRFRRGRAPSSPLVLPGGGAGRAGRRRRADRRLGHHRGRPPALGRLRGDAHRGRGHRRQRHPGRLRRAGRRVRRLRRGSVVDPAPAGRQAVPGAPRPRCRRRSARRDLPAVAAAAVRAGRTDPLHRAGRGRPRHRGLAAVHPRPRPAQPGLRLDRAGVGGQPRLADLRAHRAVDRVPAACSRRSASRWWCRCSWPRSG